MRRLVVVLLVMLTAVLLPTATSAAQNNDGADCRRGIVVEGRCLSIDGGAASCLGETCIEFVEESVDVCPQGTAPLVPTPAEGLACQRTEAAEQRPDQCPDGSRGTVGSCFIYLAMGPDGCTEPTVIDETNNCRRAVQDASGAIFCARATAQLEFADRICTSSAEPIRSPCPLGTTRASGACWRFNGLSAPETCAGHAVVGTTTLPSGECRVPFPIPTGPETCTGGAVYQVQPLWAIFADGVVIEEGPLVDGCIDGSESIGYGLRTCTFFDDDYDWGTEFIDGVHICGRFEDPVTLTCPTGYSFDDSLGGQCARFEPLTGATCPTGGDLNGQSCVFQVEYAEHTCPQGTTRFESSSQCFAIRPQQFLVGCPEPAILIPTAPVGCYAVLGLQPDICNRLGTVDDCYEINEPAPAECLTASGCVAGDFRYVGDVSCDLEISLLDALLVAQHAVSAREVAESCAGFAAATQVFTYDGDVNDDGAVDNADASLLLECAAGADAFATCARP